MYYIEKDWYLIYDFDPLEQTGLHWAAKWGNNKIIEYLLDHHAYINCVDISNWTPLYLASKLGKFETVKLLLNWGANMFTLSHKKQTSIDVAKSQDLKTYMRKFITSNKSITSPKENKSSKATFD